MIPIDQMVASFGPAVGVFSQYTQERTDTGEVVGVKTAMDVASTAIVAWRLQQVAPRGLQGVDAESRFYLVCWDVLCVGEFPFNEAMLLGRSAGMDVARLKETGLIEKTAEKVKMLPASARRREKAVKTEQEQMTLFGPSTSSGRRGRAGTSRKVNPQDEYFSSAIDMCHALALRYADAHGGDNGLAAAKGMALQLGWGADSACCKLMTALVNAAPPGVRFPGKKKQKTAADEFPEFRAWREMLKPLFSIDPPEWKEPAKPLTLGLEDDEEEEDEESEE